MNRDIEKFSLASLFSGNEYGSVKKNIGNSNEININSLFKPPNDTRTHNSRDLLENIKKKKEKVVNLYEEEYKSCWERIYEAHNCNFNYTIVTVPKFQIECDLYNPLICMQYIQNKLLKHKIGSKIVDYTRIFISWDRLEEFLSKD